MTKKKLISLFILIFAATLSACLPTNTTSSKRRSSGASTTQTNNAPDAPTFASSQEIYWYSGSTSYSNTITINEGINTVIYLRGQPIHNFLTRSDTSNGIEYKNLTYCMVASYNSLGAAKNLRVRAVPISFMNFSTNTREYLFRIDLPEDGTSTSTCSGSAYQILTTADAATAVSNSDSVFSASALCPSCNKTVSSSNISFYISNPPITVNDRISESQINLGGLVLRVTAASSASSGDVSSGSCNNSTCVAKGFDCCLDGQCVNDAELRPNASADADFNQAISDVAANPTNFINWPNIYFVCGSTPTAPAPTPTALPNAAATAAAFLQQQIADWKCLEEGKQAQPDYNGKQVCAPGYDSASYLALRSKIWADCGCQANPFPTSPDDPACPDFQLKALDVNNSEITYSSTINESSIYSVSCYAPVVNPQPTPFQNLSLSVNVRSVPHRFFKATDGQAVDKLEGLSDTTILPEGTPFQYIDNSAKTDPDCSGTDGSGGSAQCNFNMNSITGQMAVTLDQARPATVVNLDFDQSYIISTLTGYYTPCPTCNADHWFQSFMAFPASHDGIGLESISYSTNRAAFESNNTLGNYEDTIFGRACFVPPTMIPFSHSPQSTTITQRANRLQTQAALYVNGYQRDWFGFNRGALIGSFDGVKWFAIGKNRSVIASTGKLFLAINSPFGDLAENTDLTVQVLLDQGNSTAPNFDYNPNLAANDSRQGTAASCQRWHQCATDTDCITRLGWEYMCIDTSNFKTSWPKFDINAEELATQEYGGANFGRILQDALPSGSKKRCVYRGSGSICKGDFTSNLPVSKQKMLTCAPNFHCESLDNNRFNARVIRSPALQSNILYGQDTDVLGRPEHYVTGQNPLPEAVKTAIRYNALNYTTETGDIGICRPGRKINQITYVNQHASADTAGRADYISQVGTCDSSLVGVNRVLGCPIIQTADDQNVAKGDLLFTLDATIQNIQNSCGRESMATIGGVTTSLFSAIEAPPIQSAASITSETLAADACLRRPGSVCHTDLDCSPNRLHQVNSYNYGQQQFGDTQAEKLYWEENLICGQAAEKPYSSDPNYYDYDMSKNRCCREVGNDFTMFTQGDPKTNTLNSKLDVTAFPYLDPEATGRYSRYAIVDAKDKSSTATDIANSTPYAQAPIVDKDSLTMPKAYQWKAIHDTGSLTCCGGGWVRKFADGTSAWDDTTRLQIDPTEFQCLNYIYETPTELITNNNNEFFVSLVNYAKEVDRFCFSPVEGGCAEYEFPTPSTSGHLTLPLRKSSINTPNSPFEYAVLDTTPAENPTTPGNVSGMAGLSINVPFEPIIFQNPDDISTAVDDDYTYFFSQSYQAVSFYLPSYIGWTAPGQGASRNDNNLIKVQIVYYDKDGNQIDIDDASELNNNGTIYTPKDCVYGAGTQNPFGILNPGTKGAWCVAETSAGRIFHIVAPAYIPSDGTTAWAYAAPRISFVVANSPHFWFKDATSTSVHDLSREGLIGANDMYYLTKLARLELLGIPQIVYEPLYCNSNMEKMVGGIFNSSIATRSKFFNNSQSMEDNYDVNGRSLIEMYDARYTTPNKAHTAVHSVDGNTREDHANWYTGNTDKNERFMFFDESKFDLPQIFSSNEFRCCVQLGEEAAENGKCCSGYKNGDNICKLPKGVDLYVYFNQFVSGEGYGADQPGGGLVDTDFIPETGEPKVSSTVQAKLKALGESYCDSGEVRGGAAFGYYNPEPNTGGYVHRHGYTSEDWIRYTIVDSTNDTYKDRNGDYYGISTFLAGYRWNHHLYCK